MDSKFDANGVLANNAILTEYILCHLDSTDAFVAQCVCKHWLRVLLARKALVWRNPTFTRHHLVHDLDKGYFDRAKWQRDLWYKYPKHSCMWFGQGLTGQGDLEKIVWYHANIEKFHYDNFYHAVVWNQKHVVQWALESFGEEARNWAERLPWYVIVASNTIVQVCAPFGVRFERHKLVNGQIIWLEENNFGHLIVPYKFG